MYITYLLGTPINTSCAGLAEILESVSHDSVNRFLLRESFNGQDLFDSAIRLIPKHAEGVVSVDDTILDKPYSQPDLSKLVNYYWSGKHKKVIKGVNLVTLFFTDLKSGLQLPIHFKMVNPDDNKTKNEYFQDMINDILSWGLRPVWVTGDSWYSSLENLKFLRKHELNALFGVEKNRTFSEEKGSYCQAQTIESIDADGKIIYLRDFGQVRLFRQNQKNTVRHYIMIQSNVDRLNGLSRSDFERFRSAHWNIEEYHRVLKQECHVEHFQTRSTQAVMNHIFCAMAAYVQLEIKRINGVIKHWYQLKRESLTPVIRQIMSTFQVDELIHNLKPVVNA